MLRHRQPPRESPPAHRTIRPVLLEALAVVLLIFGAYALVGAFFPLINPGLAAAFEDPPRPVAVYGFGALFSVSVLTLALALSRYAATVRGPRDKSGQAEEPAWRKKVKWRLFALLLLFILFSATVSC